MHLYYFSLSTIIIVWWFSTVWPKTFFFFLFKTCFLICFIMSMLWADIVQALSDTVNLLPSEPKNCWICSPVAFRKCQHDKLTKLYILLTFNAAQVRCSLRKTTRLYIYCNVYRWKLQYSSEVEMVVTAVISSFLCFENKEPKHQALALPNRNAHTAVLYSSSQKSISVSLTSSNGVLWVIRAVM